MAEVKCFSVSAPVPGTHGGGCYAMTPIKMTTMAELTFSEQGRGRSGLQMDLQR